MEKKDIREDGKYVRMNDAKVDPKMFQTFPTGKLIDSILSDDGGLMRGIVLMVIGDPGVGKTTITSDLLADIQIQYPELDILFISSEEGFIDRAYSQRKSPKTGATLTLFLGEEKEKVLTLQDVLNQGWDIILVDSFKDTQDKIQAEGDMNSAEAEAFLLNLMVNCSHGENAKGTYTTFVCIQQVTKGKEFAGSNSLKHNTTAMMEMRFSKEFPNQRYVEFTKNRRCGAMVGEKLYYWFDPEDKQLKYSRKPNEQIVTVETNDTVVLPRRVYSLEELLEYVPRNWTIKKKSDECRRLQIEINNGTPIKIINK